MKNTRLSSSWDDFSQIWQWKRWVWI